MSAVVIASYAYPNLEADFAQALTQKQSEAVVAYLKDHHAVQKMGWFTRRKVTPIEASPFPTPTSSPKCSRTRGYTFSPAKVTSQSVAAFPNRRAS